MYLALSKYLKKQMKVDKLDDFHFRPQEMESSQPYPLLLIKYELKLPSEATPGLLSFRFRSKQCDQILQLSCVGKITTYLQLHKCINLELSEEFKKNLCANYLSL